MPETRGRELEDISAEQAMLAEHWLSAIGDTGRRGVNADARWRAERSDRSASPLPCCPAVITTAG